MSSPLPTITLVALYLLFVLVGPQIMKHRQPLNVKVPMMIYNFFMVLFSYYLFHEVRTYISIQLCNTAQSTLYLYFYVTVLTGLQKLTFCIL